jgi:hypothetical protein
MRENDCSPDLNDLNTLSLQDYERIIEKNANQRLSPGRSSPTASSWACFPPFEDPSTHPDYTMHNLISSDSVPFFPDLPFMPDYSLLAGSPMLQNPPDPPPPVLPVMTEKPEPLCILPVFPQSRSLSTSPELRTPGESGTDTTQRASTQKTTREKVPRHKRPSHINAEHRRRSKIQRCLEDLKSLVPSAADASSSIGPSGKKSKASLLFRTAGYCRQLKADCRDLQKEADALRTELQSLSAEIK